MPNPKIGAPGECGPEQSLNIKFMNCSNSVQTLFKQCSNNVQIQTLFIHCSNSFIKIQTLFKVCSIFVLPFSWSDLEGKLCSQFVQVQGSQKCHIHIVFKLCSSSVIRATPLSSLYPLEEDHQVANSSFLLQRSRASSFCPKYRKLD